MRSIPEKLFHLLNLFQKPWRRIHFIFTKTKKRRKQIAFLAGAFLIFGGPAMILSLINTKSADAWFNNDWAYRKAIPITTHTQEEKNVYIQVTLDTQDPAKFKSDCSDLRFTKKNGTLLPYFIVSGCGTDTTVIHILFDVFPSGAQTIYYYYGNPQAKNIISSADFVTEATNYTIGTVGAEENGEAPIAYWKLDEGTGTTTNDSAGNKNKGDISGATWQNSDSCIKGKCLFFDGDDYVTVPDKDYFSITQNDLTISFWAKIPANATAKGSGACGATGSYMIAKGESGKYEWGIENDSNSKLCVNFWTSNGGNYTAVSANRTMNDNNWHYYTVTMDTGNKVIVYIDGIKAGETTSFANSPSNESSPVFIGKRGDGNNFIGSIDDVKIYPYVRSYNQISADYNQGSAVVLGMNSNPQLSNGLIAYYKMDEANWNGTEGEVKDSSGNGNNATVGTATGISSGGNTSTTLNNTNQYWGAQEFNGSTITITEGTNAGESRTIVSNTTNQFTVSQPWTIIPDNTSKYRINTIPTSTTGKFGKGGYFDGVSNHIITNNIDINEKDNGVTANAWVFYTGGRSPTHDNVVISHGGGNWGPYYNWRLSISNARRLQATTNWWTGDGGDGGRENFSSIDVVPLNEWFMVTATFNYDSTTNTTHSKGYINGKLVIDAQFSGKALYNHAGRPFTIGAQTWSHYPTNPPGRGFSGKIDEVRIYKRALSPSEVSQLYNFAPGPIAYYNFEEGSGNTVKDLSGNNNTGTWNGSGNHWTDGKYGKGASFNGTNDYIVSNTNIPCSLNQSVSAWFNGIGDIEKPRTIFELASCGGRFLTYFDTSNKIAFYPHNTSSYSSMSTSTEGIWHHVTVTTQQINDTEVNARIYVDGLLERDITTTFSPPSTLNKFFVGTVATHNTNFYKGKIDDIKIYNYTRTQKQIIEDMNAGHPAGGSPVGSQIGYWKFDEGYGTIAHDTSPQKVDGTLSGSTKPTWSNDGKFGKSLLFNGSSSYISLGNIPAYKTDNKTISFWAKPNGNIGVTKPIFSLGHANWYVGFSSYTNRMIASYLTPSGYQQTSYSTSNSVIPNEWHQYTYVFSVSGNTVNISFYRDGKFIITNTYTDGYNSSYGTNAVLGAYSSSASFHSGLLDEVKIYNSALTPEEILIDYNQNAGTVMGAKGTDSSGKPSNSADRTYCPPGDTTTPCAPIAEWNFEEGTGNTVNDISGNGNTGTWSGTGKHWTQGKIGKAGNFNGIDDFVLISSNSSLYQSPVVTVAAWVKTDKEGTLQNNYSGILRTSNYKISVNHLGSNGTFNFRIYSSSNQLGPVNSTIVPKSNTWYYVVGVADGTSIKIYVNGKLEGSLSVAESMKVTPTSLVIGNDPDGPNRYFSGIIDQTRIYNYARTPAQIAWDYNKGAPIAHWKFDECQGTTIHDSSGNNNLGILSTGASGSQTQEGTCSTPDTAWGNGASGRFNASLNFDGANDYVDIYNNSSLSNVFSGDEGTASIWIKASDANIFTEGLYRNILLLYRNSDNYIQIYKDSTTNKLVTLYKAGGVQKSASTLITSTNWVHIVFTWSKSADRIIFYANGKQVSSSNTLGTWSQGTFSSTQTIIGRNITTSGDSWKGKIDDVRIYNYALTPQQVKQLYGNGAIEFSQ